jgi:hypothetical protein
VCECNSRHSLPRCDQGHAEGAGEVVGFTQGEYRDGVGHLNAIHLLMSGTWRRALQVTGQLLENTAGSSGSPGPRPAHVHA